jgi:hypothetical protein
MASAGRWISVTVGGAEQPWSVEEQREVERIGAAVVT